MTWKFLNIEEVMPRAAAATTRTHSNSLDRSFGQSRRVPLSGDPTTSNRPRRPGAGLHEEIALGRPEVQGLVKVEEEQEWFLLETIGAGPPDEDICEEVLPAVERVVAALPVQGVGARLAKELVVAGAA